MNDKVQRILVKIALALKQLRWKADKDVELTLKSDGVLQLVKSFRLSSSMGDKEWTEDLDVAIDLKFDSEDQITFFPEYTIYADMYVEGGNSHNVMYEADCSIAFTERDEEVTDPEIKKQVDAKIAQAAKTIDSYVEDHVQSEWDSYLDSNAENVQTYWDTKQWQADEPRSGEDY